MSLSTLASLGMALGAPLVYADQAYSIYRKQDARGFSHDVCAVLLIANITRCFFWLGERFEFALLLQSILMIAAQLGLLYLCIRFKPVTRWSKSISSDGARVLFNAPGDEEEERGQQQRANGGADGSGDSGLMELNEEEGEEQGQEGYANKQPLLVSLGALFRGNSNNSSSYGRLSSTDHASYNSSSNNNSLPTSATANGPTSSESRLSKILSHFTLSGGRPLNFWQWSDYNSYLVFLLLFSLVLLVLYVIFSSSMTFIALLGYIALGLESTLPIPQLLTNYRRKSLAGFRSSVLFGWLGGDSFKLLYFILRRSPAQFTSCAIFQLSIDLAILVQSRLYRAQTEKDEEELRNKQQSNTSARRAHDGEIEEDITDEAPSNSRNTTKKVQGKGNGKGKGKGRSSRDEQDGLLQDPHHVISIVADEDDDEGDISNGRRT